MGLRKGLQHGPKTGQLMHTYGSDCLQPKEIPEIREKTHKKCGGQPLFAKTH